MGIQHASVSVGDVTVGGDVNAPIVIGNNNKLYNFVTNIIHGVIIHFHEAAPAVKRRAVSPKPPRSPREFIGREHELHTLEKYIAAGEAILIHGHEGVGKTTLAEKASNSPPSIGMPDGVIFMEAVDEDGKLLGIQDIVQLLFDALYESNPQSKATLEAARTYLSNTRPLIILDRFELPLPVLNNLPNHFPNGSIIITSRYAPLDDTFQVIHLEPPPREEAIQLFAVRSGTNPDESVRSLMSQACELLGDIPLAITITANLVRNGRISLPSAVERLKAIQPPSRDKIQAAIERSYGLAYSTLNKNERDMLALVAVSPGISVDRDWLESMENGVATLESLEDLKLLQANSPRLRLPEGMRQIIQSSRKDVHSLRGALVEHFIGELSTKHLDSNYIAAELGNLLGLVQWASAEKRWADVITLGRSVDPYLTLNGLWDAWENVLKQILEAGQRLEDQAVEAWALHQLGSREIGTGSVSEAIKLLGRALRIREALGDKEGFAYTLHNLRLLLPPHQPDGTDGKSSFWDRLQYFTRGWNPFILFGWLIVAAIAVALAANLLAPRVSLVMDDKDTNRFADLGEPVEPGESISFRFIITNTGLVPIKGYAGITTDKNMGVTCDEFSMFGNFNDNLDPGESLICEAIGFITDADLREGSITNEAQAQVFTREGSRPIASEPITVTIVLNPSVKEITLDISSDINPYERVGQPITYTYAVTNTGNQPLEGTVLVEDGSTTTLCMNPDETNSSDNRLDPQEAVKCTSAYFITQADINNGSLTNTATAWMEEVESKGQLTIEARQIRELSLNITANPNTYEAPNQSIAYTYEIINSGNVSLPGEVNVSDSTVICPEPTTTGNFDELFDPGEKITCTGAYTIMQADLDNGSVTNTATAEVGEYSSEPATSTITATRRITITLTKSASPTTYNRVGQTITYTYVIRNTGNITLQPAQFYITDEKIRNGEQFTCGPEGIKLAPNETVTCTAVYNITQADFGPRSVTNTARALVEFRGSQISSEPARATVTCPYPPRGWVAYTVEADDTLFNIQTWFDEVDVAGLQQANCLGSESNIRQGQRLYIPKTPPPAKISGIVKDTQGQVLGGIPVTLMDRNGNVFRQTITGSNGTYAFSDLPSGAYRIFQVQRTLRWGESLELDFIIIPDYPD